MITLDIFLDALFAAIAGCGFGMISNPPIKALPRIALLAAVGHAIRFCLMNYFSIDIATSSFFAALAIGFGSLPLAKPIHVPLTVLYIPALLPMVPGIYAYKTVFSLIMFLHSLKDADQGLNYMELFFLNGSVAFSVIALMTVGATLPNLIFKKIAFSMTRRVPREKTSNFASKR